MSRFNEVVLAWGPRAMADLGLTAEQAAGLFGNGDVESAGFATLQEIKPTVPGSRGGYGWFQWTGPRRREYEAWCVRKGFDPAADEANYSFMFRELVTTEKRALANLKAMKTVDLAATSVCNRYLRPGIPHLERRKASARRALQLLQVLNETAAKISAPVAPVPTIPRIVVPVAVVAKPAAGTGFWARLGRAFDAFFAPLPTRRV